VQRVSGVRQRRGVRKRECVASGRQNAATTRRKRSSCRLVLVTHALPRRQARCSRGSKVCAYAKQCQRLIDVVKEYVTVPAPQGSKRMSPGSTQKRNGNAGRAARLRRAVRWQRAHGSAGVRACSVRLRQRQEASLFARCALRGACVAARGAKGTQARRPFCRTFAALPACGNLAAQRTKTRCVVELHRESARRCRRACPPALGTGNGTMSQYAPHAQRPMLLRRKNGAINRVAKQGMRRVRERKRQRRFARNARRRQAVRIRAMSSPTRSPACTISERGITACGNMPGV